MIRYFAYGSNLLPARLEARLGLVRRLGVGALAGFELQWHKRGGDGSGKCDAFATPAASRPLPGAVYGLDERQIELLDGIEGEGYRREDVRIDLGGAVVVAVTYRAQADWIAPAQAPFDWYKGFVLQGAIASGLPDWHVEVIRARTALVDPDSVRRAGNLALMSGSGPDRVTNDVISSERNFI